MEAGDLLAHASSAGNVAVQGVTVLRKGKRGSRNEGSPGLIVDDLGVDMFVAAENHEAGAVSRSVNLAANTGLAAQAAIILADTHCNTPYFLPPDLPTLRRIVSVVYLMPLPL